MTRQVGPKAKCKNCGTVVQSMFRHDFTTCKCYTGETATRGFFLDGGGSYVRWGGNTADIEWVEDEDEQI